MTPYSQYNDYKKTGLDWLREIPSHWRLIKNKYIFNEKKDTVGDNSDGYLLLSLTIDGIIPRDMENPTGKFPASFASYKIVHPDDLVFCLFDIEETPRTVGYSSHNGMITGAYTVIECEESIFSRYMYYYYLYLDNDKRLGSLYTGLRKVITRTNFFGIKTPVPPLREQVRVANFLDTKTSKIDTLIQRKQQEIIFLEEYRTALVNQAVTKGLDTNVPMKDSGVEWIGKIPEHWKSIKIKYLNSVIMGQSPSSDYYSLEKTGLPFLQGNADFTNLYPIPRVWCNAANKTSLKGDVLLSVRAPVGAVNIADQQYGIGRGLCAIRANKTIPAYLFYVMRTLQEQLNRIATGSTYKAISVSDVENTYIPHTTQTEQESIADFLNKISENVEMLVAQTNREIDLLKEYKKSLITSAVSGKIDVRNWKGEEDGIQAGRS